MLSVRPTFHSLSRCPGGSLDRTGTGTGKNLKICCRSPSPSKTCVPSDHFPQCSLHGGLCDQWFMRKRRIPTDSRLRRGMEAVGLHHLLLFCVPLSLSLFLSSYRPPWLSLQIRGGSIWVRLSQPSELGALPCPLGLQGLSVLQCGSLLLLGKDRGSCLPTGLSGPSQSLPSTRPLLLFQASWKP